VTYAQLVENFAKIGVKETDLNIRDKLRCLPNPNA